MFGADPYEERDEHEGKHEGNMREITQPTRIDHTCTRSMNTKVRYKIQSQQRTIQEVTGLLCEEVLNPRGDLLCKEEVWNPKGSSPRRGHGLSRGVDPYG